MDNEEMKKLLEKYPFLIYRNVFSREKTYKTLEEDLEHNWYKTWDGYGWEKLWKRFLKEIFKEYDKLPAEAKDKFSIYDTKEKYGTLRVSLSGYTEGMMQAETVLHLLSAYTCSCCGKVPRDSKGNHIIWTTKGWIAPYCKDCFKKYELKDRYSDDGKFVHLSKKEKEEFKEYTRNCRSPSKKYFRTEKWANQMITTTYYADNLESDWLVRAIKTTRKEK